MIKRRDAKEVWKIQSFRIYNKKSKSKYSSNLFSRTIKKLCWLWEWELKCHGQNTLLACLFCVSTAFVVHLKLHLNLVVHACKTTVAIIATISSTDLTFRFVCIFLVLNLTIAIPTKHSLRQQQQHKCEMCNTVYFYKVICILHSQFNCSKPCWWCFPLKTCFTFSHACTLDTFALVSCKVI